MSRFDWRPQPRVGVAEPPVDVHAPSLPQAPEIDTSDLAVLDRAYHGPGEPEPAAPTTIAGAQLTIGRHFADDFRDRQILLFVDGQPWGKVRYGSEITQDITPGRHRVRAFNTLFAKTMEIDVRAGEHVRLNCGNGFPRAGYLMMMFLHVTYLRVRLERDAA